MAKSNRNNLRHETKAMILADISGFSKISPDAHLDTFIESVLAPIAGMLDQFTSREVGEVNTWGDAVFAMFDNPVDCCHFAVQLRDHFRRDFTYAGLPTRLGVRIALHQGTVRRFDDPLRRVVGALGSAINLLARIEPVVERGAIWATAQMKLAIEATGVDDLKFDSIGPVVLAKSYGVADLFWVRRSDEQPRLIAPRLPGEIADESTLAYARELDRAKVDVLRDHLRAAVSDSRLRAQVEELCQIAAWWLRPNPS